MSCQITTLGTKPATAPGSLPAAEVLDQATREHLASCPSCRRAAIVHDPLRAFSLLAGPRLEPNEAAAMQARVRSSLRANQLQHSVSVYAEQRRGRVRVAAVAAGLLATAALVSLQGGSPEPQSWPTTAEMPSSWAGDEAALLRDLAAWPVLEARDGVVSRGDERAAVLVIGSLDV